MADTKISALTELAQGAIANADELPVVDTDATETKRYTWSSLLTDVAAYIATLSQTLTNKTLTSPVINTPTGIVKGDVGLGNVDNTTDAGKPVSTATQTALDLKANDNSVVKLTGDQTVAGIKTFSSTIVGSINGNAATVTTNANLTGVVTSTGNATAIADAALSIAKTSGLQAALDSKQATLVSGTNIKTVNSNSLLGSGDLVISGGISWSEVTGTTQAMAVDTAYIANNAALVVLTLPDTAAVGKVVRVAGKGAGGWKIAQNASEIIHFGTSTTTTGTGGSLASTATYDAVELVCVVANTEWVVISSIGNITIV